MAASQAPERRLHLIRWFLTTGWLLIIGSLFFDPFSARFTEPDHPWSPLRLTEACVPVQGRCLVEQPYPLGTTLFWGAVVPAGIFVLLVFGHELWRRICPLSFLSQIPRALGRQRQVGKKNPKTGEIRYQLAKVPADSWLAKHYSKLQFGWLFVGLCGRILFFNADRLVLAGWLLFTIAAAITVGWLYGGKAWCQYFCPMAPVQSIYSTPAGLLGSPAHMASGPITQSMCRTTLPDGSEQSACVACQQPCIDIDAERLYWARIGTPDFAFERYGYVGLVLGYFLYYYLYAGNWTYYFSGAWARQSDQLSQLLSPGLFLFGQPIDVPRIVAVPLVLGLFTWLGLLVGQGIEGWMRRRARRQGAEPDRDQIRHRVFVAATFLVFNFFFLFAGRPLLQLAPAWVVYLFDVSLVAASTLWLFRAWRRTPALYGRENLAERFRRQLERLGLDVSRYLEGRTLGDLSPDEVYVLARVLPGFGSEQRHEAYKGVVREALEEGYVNAASSLEVLQQMRRELGITDDEHRQLLDELGVEDPGLLDPGQRRSLEEQVRLSGYRRSLERLMRLQQGAANLSPGQGVGGEAEQAAMLRQLRRQFSIDPAEEALVREQGSAVDKAARRAELLLQRLPELIEAYRSLHQPALRDQPLLVALLDDHLCHRKELALEAILSALATLNNGAPTQELVARLQAASPWVLQDLLARGPWRQRLPGEVFEALSSPGAEPVACSLEVPVAHTLQHLERLSREGNPIEAASALVLVAVLSESRGRSLAQALLAEAPPPLVKDTAERLLRLQGPPELAAFPPLEKRVVLASSDFFRRTWADTLEALAERSDMRTYGAGALITETGDTCRELLLLVDGAATVQHREGAQTWEEQVRPGHVLDELEVLTHSAAESTIVAEAEGTRVLAVPVDSFDTMLERDPDFARRVLDLESRQLQRLTRAGRP